MTTILTTVAQENQKRPILTKTFTRLSSGDITKADYDRAYLFDATPLDINSIDELHDVLMWLEGQPHSCIVRAEPIGATRAIRRALSDHTVKGPATLRPIAAGLNWVMLDFDKLPVSALGLDDNASRLAYLVSLLPAEFQDATFHYQWSSSAGTDGWATLSCHLWFWLRDAWACRDLFERFHDGDFKDHEVDPAPFTSNQVHYTANPVFVAMDDPVDQRSGLVRGASDAVTLSTWFKPVVPAPQHNHHEHYRLFGHSRFETLLADIGPNFHRPILRAVAHYFAVVDPDKIDAEYVRDQVIEAIHNAVPGRSRKADYLDRHYLDRVIAGASSKFGGTR